MSLTPSAYKISTITATGTLPYECIDLELLYNSIEITEPSAQFSSGFSYIEYGEKKGDVYSKGFHKKMNITRRKQKDGKRFDNQATVIIWMRDDSANIVKTNMKVFKNGNVQMTGLKIVDQGKQSIQFMTEHLSNVDGFQSQEKDGIGYKIRLINSDYRLGIEIKRDKLHKIVHQQFNVFCSYEPCIYPGVKIQYNFNKSNQQQDGVCHCTKKCNGKGDGIEDGDCKKITIAVFQSGCVIITGAQSTTQIDQSYAFINNVISKNKTEVEKHQLIPVPSH